MFGRVYITLEMSVTNDPSQMARHKWPVTNVSDRHFSLKHKHDEGDAIGYNCCVDRVVMAN